MPGTGSEKNGSTESREVVGCDGFSEKMKVQGRTFRQTRKHPVFLLSLKS